MLKRILLVIALLGIIASPVFAVNVEWYGVWYENRIYDHNFNTNNAQLSIAADVQLSGVADPYSVGVSVSSVGSSVFSSSLNYLPAYSGGSIAEYYASVSPYPSSSAFETTYDFHIDGVASPPYVTIPDNTLKLLDYAIPEFNGGMVSWQSVDPEAGGDIRYRVWAYEFENGNAVGSPINPNNSLTGTSYDLSLLDPGEYAVRLEAREYFGNDTLPGDYSFLNRSTSYTYWNKTTAAVPEPATMLLFGAGLVGLAGFGRKKFKK